MISVSFLLPLLGGLTLGLGALWLLYSLGRIAGISGIVWGALAGPDRDWRWFFLAGLLGGGTITHWVFGLPLPAESTASMGMLISSGLLVGLGTRLGGGCTSGHGVCGIGRRSLRSVVATLIFMMSGMLTVYVVRHVLGGGV
ncbi:YeeE/YedE family protein [Luminiphilus sp.]|nr:YeeE/YedE family protein [Luminiphilus sp.]MDA8986022.1 YeeE/YedE family protein [Luminiphilus sp.]